MERRRSVTTSARKGDRAEHILTHSSHEMLFEKTKVLTSSAHLTTWLHREAIEIHKRRCNHLTTTVKKNTSDCKAWYPTFRASRGVAGDEEHKLRLANLLASRELTGARI